MDGDRLQTYAEEVITVGATAVGLTNSTTYLGASPPPDQVDITVESAQLRYRLDGTAATASIGEAVNPFDRIKLRNRNEMFNFSAIRTGGTSASIRVRYRRAY